MNKNVVHLRMDTKTSTYLKHRLVKKRLSESGYRLTWVYNKMAVSRQAGSLLLNYGVLPSDRIKRAEILQVLSKLTSIPQAELTLTVNSIEGSGAA